MNLVVFDVDGTLVTLHPQDDACYIEAIRSHEQLEKVNISSEWDHYNFSTDSGVLYEIFLKHLKRAPSEAEGRHIESRYTQLLGASLESCPIIREVPGATRAFSFLTTTGSWLPAVATGSWKDSTQLKLQFTGISCDVPLACADDSFDRCEIVKTAIQRASDYYRVPRFSEIVYVGDRHWDYDTARHLDIGFLGITYCSISPFPACVRSLRHFLDEPDFIDALSSVVRK